jgi:hypothetical protein
VTTTKKESKPVTKDPICGMTVEEATVLTPIAMERRSTFAATTVDKRFRLRPPVSRRRASLEAAVDNNAANEGVISAATGRVAVRVIYTDEEWMIAKTVCRVLGLG